MKECNCENVKINRLGSMNKKSKKICFAKFLEVGSVDTFNGFVKMFREGIFCSNCGEILEY